eukprot:4747510-Amphidinium_carterae.1
MPRCAMCLQDRNKDCQVFVTEASDYMAQRSGSRPSEERKCLSYKTTVCVCMSPKHAIRIQIWFPWVSLSSEMECRPSRRSSKGGRSSRMSWMLKRCATSSMQQRNRIATKPLAEQVIAPPIPTTTTTTTSTPVEPPQPVRGRRTAC